MAPGTIEARRAAILRGHVRDGDDQPLEGVQIQILGAPEYGATVTRANGMFDLAVNGGGPLTVTYTKAGFIPVQRQVEVPWQDCVWVADVVMMSYDGQVASVDLTAPGAFQVADGGAVSDGDGTRQPRLLFPQGTVATLVFASGPPQAASMPLAVRATEFTVGPNGPAAMPAELPATSAYTYAVELSVDEGVQAGAAAVSFSQPVIFYLENFIDLPVGLPVPTGYYDRALGQWIASADGRIVKILGFDAQGRAELDTDGDDQIDNGTGLGITDDERAQLTAPRYAVNQSLWRVPISHFTPWDCNFPYVPPEDAKEPQLEPEEEQPEDDPDSLCGSIIECQNQVLGESVPVVGTPFRLHYRSNRAPGHRSAYTIRIPLSGSTIPASLKRIELEVSVAGRRFAMTADPPEANLSTTFTWDGRDAYGRVLQGAQPAVIEVGYVYDGVYAAPDTFGQSFGRFSGVPISASRTRREITLRRGWRQAIGPWDARAQGLAGWTLDAHHVLDTSSATVYFGDGRHARSRWRDLVIDTVAGSGTQGFAGDGGPATEAALSGPHGVSVAPDGGLYIADRYNARIRYVDPSGTITTVAGTGSYSAGIDGALATASPIGQPAAVAIAPDGTFYLVDRVRPRVYRVDPGDTLHYFAGTGIAGFNGDGMAATSAQLWVPTDVAVGPDGSVYIAEDGNARVRRVGTDGIISTVAGTGGLGATGDGGPATSAQIGNSYGVAVGPDGSVYIADRRNHLIRRVGPDGIITTIAGVPGEPSAYDGDGGPATAAHLNQPLRVAVDRDGTVYIADAGNRVVRRIAPTGILTTLAGQGSSGFAGDGGPAAAARLSVTHGVAVTPDHGVVVVDRDNQRVRKIRLPLAGTTLIPSADGTEAYEFDIAGRHLRTRHALAGATLLTFGYDLDDGLLATVTDGDGNVTTIERDASGNPTAIVGPFGQRTSLGLDANGFLASVDNPASERTDFLYNALGLMTRMTDPETHSHTFTYDAEGRLTRDEDPAGGFKTLGRTEGTGSFTVTVTSGLEPKERNPKRDTHFAHFANKAKERHPLRCTPRGP